MRHIFLKNRLLSLIILLVLTGCGDSLKDEEIEKKSAPVITSSATVSAAYTQTEVFTITATDADGDTLSYSLTGVDADKFDVDSSTGVITLKTTIDYSTQSIYYLTVNVSDTTNTTTQVVNISLNSYVQKRPILIEKVQVNDAQMNDFFGCSVATSGKYVVVGAWGEDTKEINSGATYIYEYGMDGTLNQIAKLYASDAKAYDNFGDSVSISGDYIAVGVWGEDTNGNAAGSAYIFKIYSDNSVTQIAKIKASDAQASDWFGKSVSISGDYVVVGALREDTTGVDAGSAYVFKINSDDSVTQIAKIQASDIQEYDQFGKSVSISGDYVVVGSHQSDAAAVNSGSAYVFKINSDDSVIQIAKIQASDAEAFDLLGNSVSISGDYIVIGASRKDTVGAAAGSAYVFKRNSDANITQIAKIVANDTETDDYFGNSVSISGDYIAVGAFKEDSLLINVGSAYVFKINSDTNITQVAKIQATDAEYFDSFGNSVSISGDYIVAGAMYKDINETVPDIGNVYSFKMDSN